MIILFNSGVDLNAIKGVVDKMNEDDSESYGLDALSAAKQRVDRQWSDDHAFCDEDDYTELSTEYGNPEALAMQHERESGVPLALEHLFSPVRLAMKLL